MAANTKTIFCLSLFGLCLAIDHGANSTENKFCWARGTCSCDCSWAHAGCGRDDGSCCWGCCCSGPSPGPAPGPSPGPAPGPRPSPSPGASQYCLDSNDLIVDYGGSVSLNNGGWRIQ